MKKHQSSICARNVCNRCNIPMQNGVIFTSDCSVTRGNILNVYYCFVTNVTHPLLISILLSLRVFFMEKSSNMLHALLVLRSPESTMLRLSKKVSRSIKITNSRGHQYA